MTLIEKVKKLISMAKFHKEIQEYLNQSTNLQNYAFYKNEAIKEIIDFDFSERETFSNQFNGCAGVERIVIENHIATNYARAFTGCSGLKSVKTLDFTYVSNANGWLIGCDAVEEILFETETISISLSVPCPKLTAKSVQNIFDGLSSTATGKTLTLPPAFEKDDAEAVVTANIEEVDGLKRIKGKEGWSLVR